MNIDLSNRLYTNDGRVYYGTTELTIHNQRGRLFVKHKGRQLNVKNIPVLPGESDDDPVFHYVFGGGFQNYPCIAMDYWIVRYGLKRNTSIKEFKKMYEKAKN